MVRDCISRGFILLVNQSLQFIAQIKIKFSLYSPYYAEACNELHGPSPRLSAWATQLRRNVATVASRWRHYVDLTGPVIEPQTSRADSVRLATELMAKHRLTTELMAGSSLLLYLNNSFL